MYEEMNLADNMLQCIFFNENEFILNEISQEPASRGPFYQHGLTLISAWISNYISSKVWEEITYPFQNISRTPVDVWE